MFERQKLLNALDNLGLKGLGQHYAPPPWNGPNPYTRLDQILKDLWTCRGSRFTLNCTDLFFAIFHEFNLLNIKF